MNPILDQFAPITIPLQPKTANEVFALRLAQKLGEASAFHHYLGLVDRYLETQLLSAYRQTIRAGGNGDLGRRFHTELGQVTSNGNHDHQSNLIAIRVERRTVAAAIFRGEHLEYTDSRQLSSTHGKALTSAVGFIGWLLGQFPVESATLESIPNGNQYQRQVLQGSIAKVLREQMLPIWEVVKQELLAGFGHPPLKSRNELRQIATSIWPILAGTHAKLFVQDAAILGLHVQIERLFVIN